MPNFKRTKDSVSALAALYQGEKTDASYLFNTSMVMMGAAVVYLVGAIPFVEKLCKEPFGWLFVLLLPIPLWLVVAFHSLMTLNAMSHGISVRIIEDELYSASGLRARRRLVGSAAGDEIMDVTKAHVVHRITTRVVYGGVGFLVIVFTAYVLYAAIRASEAYVALFRALAVGIAITTYAFLVIMVVTSWIVGVRKIQKGRAEIEKLATTSREGSGRLPNGMEDRD
jgi:hypothetical protein